MPAKKNRANYVNKNCANYAGKNRANCASKNCANYAGKNHVCINCANL